MSLGTYNPRKRHFDPIPALGELSLNELGTAYVLSPDLNQIGVSSAVVVQMDWEEQRVILHKPRSETQWECALGTEVYAYVSENGKKLRYASDRPLPGQVDAAEEHAVVQIYLGNVLRELGLKPRKCAGTYRLFFSDSDMTFSPWPGAADKLPAYEDGEETGAGFFAAVEAELQ